MGGKRIQTTHLRLGDEHLHPDLRGRRIVHISDLHNALFGPVQSDLLAAVSNARPDLIVATGDMIDSRRTDLNAALIFLRGAVNIAPVCAVGGNHESRISVYKDFKAGMEALGVKVLDDLCAHISWGSGDLLIAGLLDAAFFGDPMARNRDAIAERLRALLSGQKADYTILLSHRPELWSLYENSGANLVFSGHAHGGQVRLPLLGGVYAPGQGLFPKYTAGLHRLGETAMVVSRGLGPSRFPLRPGNPPEVVVLTLAPE